MTTMIDRAEINRRHAARSTGPRTPHPQGESRPRLDALKHGCRARLPILPGEDPAVYQRRLDAWLDKFAPRDAVAHDPVQRAVHASYGSTEPTASRRPDHNDVDINLTPQSI